MVVAAAAAAAVTDSVHDKKGWFVKYPLSTADEFMRPYKRHTEK